MLNNYQTLWCGNVSDLWSYEATCHGVVFILSYYSFHLHLHLYISGLFKSSGMLDFCRSELSASCCELDGNVFVQERRSVHTRWWRSWYLVLASLILLVGWVNLHYKWSTVFSKNIYCKYVLRRLVKFRVKLGVCLSRISFRIMGHWNALRRRMKICFLSILFRASFTSVVSSGFLHTRLHHFLCSLLLCRQRNSEGVLPK